MKQKCFRKKFFFQNKSSAHICIYIKYDTHVCRYISQWLSNSILLLVNWKGNVRKLSELGEIDIRYFQQPNGT